MTTKQSSTNPFFHTFKANLKGLALFPAILNLGIISFFTIILSATTLFSKVSITDDMGNVTGSTSAKSKFFALFLSESSMSVTALLTLIALASLAVAICTFYFITSKKNVNVYFSLGISRKDLFLSKYLSGAILLGLSVFIPLFITLVLNFVTLGFNFYILKAFSIYLLSLLMVSLASYSIGAAIFTCVGTVFEAGIFSVIILFLPNIISYSIEALMTKFLYGTPYGMSFIPINSFYYNGSYLQSLSNKISFLSPVFFPSDELLNFGSISKEYSAEGTVLPVDLDGPNFLYVFVWIIFTALLAFVGIKLFERRKAEIAGFIGTNRILNTVSSFAAGFFAFVIAVVNIEKLVPALLWASLCFAAVHLGLEILVLRDLKKFVKGIYKLPIGIVFSVVIVVILNSGFFGFSTQLPEYNNIKSVAVSFSGITSDAGLFGEDYYTGDSNLRYFNQSPHLVGEMTTENDIKAVLNAHKIISETSPEERNYKNTIQFSYTLKDGTSFKRNFEGVSKEGLKATLYLEDTDFYKETLYNLYKGTFVKNTDISALSTTDSVFYKAKFALRDSSSIIKLYSKFNNKACVLTPTEKDRQKLLDALYFDLSNRSVTEKYYPETSPVAFISFEGDTNFNTVITDNGVVLRDDIASEKEDVTIKKTKIEFSDFASNSGSFYISSNWNPYPFVVVTPDMTETIKILKELKIYDTLIKSPEFISAEILPAKESYEECFRYQTYIESRLSRYFLTTFTSTEPLNEEYGFNYYNMIDEQLIGLSINDKKEIDELLKYARTAYTQDEKESGYFVIFYTENNSSSICFIPENELPQQFKNQVFVQTTK